MSITVISVHAFCCSFRRCCCKWKDGRPGKKERKIRGFNYFINFFNARRQLMMNGQTDEVLRTKKSRINSDAISPDELPPPPDERGARMLTAWGVKTTYMP